MQEHSLGVRIAAGRKGQTASRKAQVAAGLTDKKVAEMLDVPRSTVCKWHLGQTRIPASSADRLARKGIPRSSWSKIDE
jgi:plasmid maintenance system antidote protein VapI